MSKAFASPRRLEIVELLGRGERTVESIATTLDQKVGTVSAHLQILRMSNLVASRREGTHVYYRLAGPDVAALFDQLHRVATTHSAEVGRALDAYLGTGDEVDEVSHEELRERMATGDLTLIDVREPHEFAEAHLPGAINVPLGQLAEELGSLAAGDREIVAYCRGAYCVLAHDAVRLLAAHGLPAERLHRLQDGILEWQAAGHPVEVGA
ncbi:ArsR/SmtB family transcription factor [Ornithinimicrobium panacihumi]|uniref:ArsR/SmtB family transcription factor n=1 Tax=Ornithinimicrobium panacihumi TaxID=2008449 RepID=UPI003F89469D